MLIAMTSYHVANIQKNNCHPCFLTTLLCKEKESTKHLLVTSLIAGKSLRTHTISKSRREGNLCKGIVAFMVVGLKQSTEAATSGVL